ncbi:regulatory protein RecX [Isoalcanivorax indicus]|uniref:regulatory protein RecX n=1 Tax=Isoalcanivorax indicus TaxID=2202653 RepID=UPI000DBA9462|nr:regulatory protein RecX [Isoalcanivorax indicus]
MKQQDANPAEPPTEAALRSSALNMLARREFARAELARRLYRKFGDDAPVEPVLAWLEEMNFLNEARYAGMLVRSHIERGHGLLRIRQTLQQNGIAPALAEQALAEADCDWFALAAETRQRRFGQGAPADIKDKARQLRFLQYRGFTGEQCFAALDEAHDPD